MAERTVNWRGAGNLVTRGDPAYERAWAAQLFNELKPSRHPDVIVRATSEADVQEAVWLARSHGLRISVRSGGHSWCGSPLRDGGMLIDLSGLRHCEIDPGSLTASVQPAVTGRELTARLAPYGLSFPGGHCGTVALGGYLLSGGLGWNSTALGPACASVTGIEAVTTDGDVVRCDERRNPDLFWAARGAGPGFFAVVTRFRLTLHPLPSAVAGLTYAFPLDDVDLVTRWVTEAAVRLPPTVETSLMLGTAAPHMVRGGSRPKAVMVTGTAFAISPDQALRALAPLRDCPFAGRALYRQPAEPTSVEELYETSATLWPTAHRNAVDTLWSDAGHPTLLTRLAGAVAAAPSDKSLVLAPLSPAGRDRTLSRDMAFSALGESYLAAFSIWDDPAQDTAGVQWLRRTMTAVESLGTGHYIAEADLSAAPARAERSYTPQVWDRLRALRVRYDPEGVFHTYLTA